MALPGHSYSLSGQTIFLLLNEREEIVCLTSKPGKLREAIEAQIHHKKMKYCVMDGERGDILEEIRTLRADWKSFAVERINSGLHQGRVQTFQMSKKGSVALGKLIFEPHKPSEYQLQKQQLRMEATQQGSEPYATSAKPHWHSPG